MVVSDDDIYCKISLLSDPPTTSGNALSNLLQLKERLSKEEMFGSSFAAAVSVEDIVDAVLKVMKQHVHDAKVQDQACQVLDLLACNTENATKILWKGGINSILDALITHPCADQPELHVHGRSVLAKLVYLTGITSDVLKSTIPQRHEQSRTSILCWLNHITFDIRGFFRSVWMFLQTRSQDLLNSKKFLPLMTLFLAVVVFSIYANSIAKKDAEIAYLQQHHRNEVAAIHESYELRKALIKSADMDSQMQQDAVEIASKALSQYKTIKSIATYISREFDRKHSPYWHVVVSQHEFAYSVQSSSSSNSIHFMIGNLEFFLYKAPRY